ncbi:hypothetical protein [Cryobacterium sp. CG_9.6]|uniref:hypothetical protein n=1 Tax=Cryobacterium sp. CG_9.6 TaxID=2760710 RepID=UPI002475999B|nr:hypothetical protein [Cryobacterium sp. CG_9.6]MDH6238590.1 hypothetical protein [Cryobacterium sp. CG_9.6]
MRTSGLASDPAAGTAPANLATILGGGVPTFLVHKSYQGAKRVPEALGYINGLHSPDLGIGVVVPLHNHKRTAVEQFVANCQLAPVILIDPELHYATTSAWESHADAKVNDDWINLMDAPQKPKAKWIKLALDIQIDLGATVSLSASGWVDATDGTRSIARAMSFVDESRSYVGSEAPMAVNLTFDWQWLVDEELRATLLQEIVESNERLWYLRFYWPEIPVRYGQLTDAAILAGYRELAELCALEDKQLFLPNSGLTGWVATALGATGFSTGQAWPEQAFARQRIMGGRKGQRPPPRIPRYFDSQLIHTIEYSEFERLSELEPHEELVTPYSLEIEEEGHSHELGGLHYLMAVADLQSKLKGKRPEAKSARKVKAATKFIDELRRADQPAGLNRPLHLAAWKDVLS